MQFRIDIALKYVAIAHRYRLLVESCSKVLQEYNDESLQEDSYIMEKYSKLIHQKIDELLMYIQLIQINNFYSEDLYRQAEQVQVVIRKAYLQALEIYLNTTDKRIEILSQPITE